MLQGVSNRTFMFKDCGEYKITLSLFVDILELENNPQLF